MALKEFKAQAAELTAPRSAQPAFAPIIHSKLQFSSSNDPIAEKLERAEMNGSPDIDNSGRGALRMRNHAFEINDIYISTAEKEDEQRWDNGGLTNFEAHVATSLAIQDLYYSSSSSFFNYSDFSSPTNYFGNYTDLTSYYGADSGFTMGNSFTNSFGNMYTPIFDADGNFAFTDTSDSCFFGPTSLRGGSALEASLVTTLASDDLLDEGQKDTILNKYDADGNKVARTPEEASIQMAVTQMENDALKLPLQLNMTDRIIADVVYKSSLKPAQNDPSFTSAAPSAIASTVTPTSTFTEAATGADAPAATQTPTSVVFKATKPAAPWETAPASANDPKFLLAANL